MLSQANPDSELSARSLKYFVLVLVMLVKQMSGGFEKKSGQHVSCRSRGCFKDVRGSFPSHVGIECRHSYRAHPTNKVSLPTSWLGNNDQVTTLVVQDPIAVTSAS